MEVGNPEPSQKEESFNQEAEEVEINLSADVGTYFWIKFPNFLQEEKIRNLDEFAKDKTEEHLVQIRVHQLALAKVFAYKWFLSLV